MIVIVCKYLIPKGYRGLTLFPFVFLLNKKDKANYCLLNHEKIHIKQQLELLIVLFYIWYVIEFLYLLYLYKDTKKAYLNISFEKEAYSNEKDYNYLQNRPFWNFIIYLKK